MAKDETPPPPEFPADAVVGLRKTLKLTQKDLALKLGVETSLVVEWEKGAAFPTLATAKKLYALREGLPLETRTRRVQTDPLKGLLADADFWKVVRKLLAHRELYAQVQRLASGFDDPADPNADKPKTPTT